MSFCTGHSWTRYQTGGLCHCLLLVDCSFVIFPLFVFTANRSLLILRQYVCCILKQISFLILTDFALLPPLAFFVAQCTVKLCSPAIASQKNKHSYANEPILGRIVWLPCKILTTNIWGSQFGFHNVLNLQSPTSLITLVILVKFWKNSGLRGNISNLLKVDWIDFCSLLDARWPPKNLLSARHQALNMCPTALLIALGILVDQYITSLWSPFDRALVTLQRIKNAPSKALYLLLLLLLLLLSEFQSVSIRRLSLLQAASKQLRADD